MPSILSNLHALYYAALKVHRPICPGLCADDKPVISGTLLLKDGSHKHHQSFFETESVLSQQQKEKTEDY